MGKPGMLQFMGSQRVGHNLVCEQLLQIKIHFLFTVAISQFLTTKLHCLLRNSSQEAE